MPQARPQLARAVPRHRRPQARAVVHWLNISPLASAWPLLLLWALSSLEHPRILFASALDFQARLQDLVHFPLGRVKAIVVISVSAYTIFIHVVGKLVFALLQMVSAFCHRTVCKCLFVLHDSYVMECGHFVTVAIVPMFVSHQARLPMHNVCTLRPV